MQNPLDLPTPEDFLERLHAFARDLAWGVVAGKWAPRFDGTTHNLFAYPYGGGRAEPLLNFVEPKWQPAVMPRFDLLATFGYLTATDDGQRGMIYHLTEKAFDLLSQPGTEPKIFVSYRRAESTAFALLVESRLRLAGNQAVFVDKLLEIGGDWRQELQDRIRESQYLIVLIGATTFESEWVKQEVALAAEVGATIIPIWQAGVRRDATTPQIINDRQEIRVERETADGYETAINKLLNRLGYATY